MNDEVQRIVKRREIEDRILALSQQRDDAAAALQAVEESLWGAVYEARTSGALSLAGAAVFMGCSQEWVRKKLLPFRNTQ